MTTPDQKIRRGDLITSIYGNGLHMPVEWFPMLVIETEFAKDGYLDVTVLHGGVFDRDEEVLRVINMMKGDQVEVLREAGIETLNIEALDVARI